MLRDRIQSPLSIFRRYSAWWMATALLIPAATLIAGKDASWAHYQPFATVLLLTLLRRPKSQREGALWFIRTTAVLWLGVVAFLIAAHFMDVDPVETLSSRSDVWPLGVAFFVVASTVANPSLNEDEWSKRLIFGASLAWTTMAFDRTTASFFTHGYFSQYAVDLRAQWLSLAGLSAMSIVAGILLSVAIVTALLRGRFLKRPVQPLLLATMGLFVMWLFAQAAGAELERNAILLDMLTLEHPHGWPIDALAYWERYVSIMGVVLWLGGWLGIAMLRKLRDKPCPTSFWPLVPVLLLHTSGLMSPIAFRGYVETSEFPESGFDLMQSPATAESVLLFETADHVALFGDGSLRVRGSSDEWRALTGWLEPSFRNDVPTTVTVWLGPRARMANLIDITERTRIFDQIQIVWREHRVNEEAERRWSWARRPWRTSQTFPLIDCSWQPHDACERPQPQNWGELLVSDWLQTEEMERVLIVRDHEIVP